MTDQPWCLSHRFDPGARVLADRHYSRQKIGDPQFVRPGYCLVLLSDCGRAYWVTSWQPFVKHKWPGAWECTAFRSEGAGKASDLIRAALGATVARFGPAPEQGMITMINRKKVKPTLVRGKEVYGWTFLKAGFETAGESGNGLLVLQCKPERMPEALPAKPRSMNGSPLFDFARQEAWQG